MSYWFSTASVDKFSTLSTFAPELMGINSRFPVFIHISCGQLIHNIQNQWITTSICPHQLWISYPHRRLSIKFIPRLSTSILRLSTGYSRSKKRMWNFPQRMMALLKPVEIYLQFFLSEVVAELSTYPQPLLLLFIYLF